MVSFDTLMRTMGGTGVRVRFSGILKDGWGDGRAGALEGSFKLESGTWSTEYHPSVSVIDATWYPDATWPRPGRPRLR